MNTGKPEKSLELLDRYEELMKKKGYDNIVSVLEVM